MRTTLRLDKQLLKLAKERALNTGRTLTSVVEDGLRLVLLPKASEKKKSEINLHTFRGNGLCQGVELDDSGALLGIMDDK